jgi:DNA-binding NtrC family response regulator
MKGKGILETDFVKRLGTYNIYLPAIRERGDDKLILARFFLNKFSRDFNVSKNFTSEAVDAIRNYSWPGNVREIINKVRMAVLISSGLSVTTSDLDLETPALDTGTLTSLRDVRSTVERQKLIEALKVCNNNISKTAKVLGISRPSVYNLKKKYGI